MDDELLSAVIRLEDTILQELETERSRAEDWLEQVRNEQEGLLHRAEQELAELQRRALAEARQRAEEQAKRIEARMAGQCRCLEAIGDDALREMLQRQLVKIMPDQGDDHQDVQS